MTALFERSTAPSRSQKRNLVEFRAGKMIMKGRMVHPDKRKGLVYIHQSEDSLMHFCWKDRTTGAVEDVLEWAIRGIFVDLIIFPDDIEFKHVSQCTTGRVYVLKFKSSSRKFFFWLQEPRTDQDAENCKKVNDFLNSPPALSSSRRPNFGGRDFSGLGEQDLQGILGRMNQQQLMQLLGGMGMGSGSQRSRLLGSLLGRASSSQSSVAEPPLLSQAAVSRTTPGEAASSLSQPVVASNAQQTTGSGGSHSLLGSGATSGSSAFKEEAAATRVQLSDLQNILPTLSASATPGTGQEGVDFARSLNPEAMIPILAHPEVQRRLVPFLPEGMSLPKTEEELRNSIHSPQFQQALNSFSAALQAGQLGLVMSQFGLGEDMANAATHGDMEAFVRAMQEATKKRKDEDKDGSMEH